MAAAASARSTQAANLVAMMDPMKIWASWPVFVWCEREDEAFYRAMEELLRERKGEGPGVW